MADPLLVNGEPVEFDQPGNVLVFRGREHRHGDRFLAVYDPPRYGTMPIAENGVRTVRYDSERNRCVAEFSPFKPGDLEQANG